MPDRYRIALSKQVAIDLERIFEHIARDSPQNALKMVNRILKAIEGLDLFPHRNVVARQHPRLRHPVRSLPVQSYLIFFRVLEDSKVVRILQVRHGARRGLGDSESRVAHAHCKASR